MVNDLDCSESTIERCRNDKNKGSPYNENKIGNKKKNPYPSLLNSTSLKRGSTINNENREVGGEILDGNLGKNCKLFVLNGQNNFHQMT